MSAHALVAVDVGRRFTGRWALRAVNLEVRAGSSLLLHGANGSGKTTLLRILSSALSPTLGRVEIHGAPAAQARSRLALLTHADGHYDDLSGRENLELAHRLGRMPGSVATVLERVGLAARANDAVRGYSAGMRKRLAFARLLLKEPAMALFDEPYAALDTAGHALVDGLFAELRARGCTVVVSTHQVARVAAVCDDAIQLQDGQIVARGPEALAAARAAGPPGDDAAGAS